MGNEGETGSMVTKYKVLDFLEELPRKMHLGFFLITGDTRSFVAGEG
jgi:hypothetical protein